MPATTPAPRPLLLLFPFLLLAGCGPTAGEPEPPVLRPVSGVVTLDGKPLEKAVVTFLNADERGTPSLGETDATGAFRLKYAGAEGTAAGPYRVAVSYLMGTKGQLFGIAERSTMSPTRELNTAKELLPPRYSDLGRTTLKADVLEAGGTFAFDLQGPLLDPPTPSDPADAPAEPPAPADAPVPAEPPTASP
jgi:hypothetical protein